MSNSPEKRLDGPVETFDQSAFLLSDEIGPQSPTFEDVPLTEIVGPNQKIESHISGQFRVIRCKAKSSTFTRLTIGGQSLLAMRVGKGAQNPWRQLARVQGLRKGIGATLSVAVFLSQSDEEIYFAMRADVRAASSLVLETSDELGEIVVSNCKYAIWAYPILPRPTRVMFKATNRLAQDGIAYITVEIDQFKKTEANKGTYVHFPQHGAGMLIDLLSNPKIHVAADNFSADADELGVRISPQPF